MSMTSRWFASVILFVAGVAAAEPQVSGTSAGNPTVTATATAPAQAAAGAKDSRSLREILDSATRLFTAGSYDQAIVEFQLAYQKRQLPTLLFNIAQAHRKAGHWAEALALYERFLKDDPKSALLPEAEAHAAAMRARLDAEKASAEREAAERLAKRRTEEAEALAIAREAERKKPTRRCCSRPSKKKSRSTKRPGFGVFSAELPQPEPSPPESSSASGFASQRRLRGSRRRLLIAYGPRGQS
jgi:tetratricopeptide (TPR) repeat protein